jgi:hypothetical protein
MPETSMQISVHDSGFMAQYQALWRAHDSNSFFRSPAHLQMIAELTCSELVFVVASQTGKAVAALPAAGLAGAYGTVINSLPYYGTYSGMVGSDDADVCKMLQAGLMNHARAIGASAVTVVDDWRAKCFAGTSDATFITDRTNQFIDLSSFRGHEPMEFYHQKTRNLVRKAEKLGVSVHRSNNSADIDGLAAAHGENMAGVNGIAKPERFFELLRSTDNALGLHRLYVASLEGRHCGYLLNFYCGDTVEYYMPAVYVADRIAQPLSLLIHYALKEAVADGFAYWNFGGTWPTQDSLRHFKIRWGSQETKYSYFTYILDLRILKQSASDLLAAYPYFFIAPFERLGQADARGEA